MSIVQRHLAEHEERLALIEEICIDKAALVLDTVTDEVFFSADEDAYKHAYVTVFQAWAKALSRARPNRFLTPQNLSSRTRGDLRFIYERA